MPHIAEWRALKTRLEFIDANIQSSDASITFSDALTTFAHWLGAWDQLIACFRDTPGLTLVAVDLTLEADIYEWLDAFLDAITRLAETVGLPPRLRRILREYLDVLEGAFPGGDVRVRSLLSQIARRV